MDILNKQDKDGNTLIHNLCHIGDYDAIQKLLPYKPNCKIKNNDGLFALDIARNKNNRNIVELLIPYTYKIALLLSGEIRIANISKDTYLKHFPGCDIYVTVSNNDAIKANYDLGGYKKSRKITKEYIRDVFKDHKLKDIQFVEDIGGYDDMLNKRLDEVYELLSKKETKHARFKEYIDSFLKDKRNSYIGNVIDQYLRFHYCYNMIKEDYDLVVRIRPDCFVLEDCNVWKYIGKGFVYVNDCFFFGSQNEVKIMSNSFYEIYKMYDESHIIPFSAEFQIENYIEMVGIKRMQIYMRTHFLCDIEKNPKAFEYGNKILKLFDDIEKNLTIDCEKVYNMPFRNMMIFICILI